MTVESVPTFDSVLGDNGFTDVAGTADVWFSEEVIITGSVLGVILESSGEMIDGPDDATEMLAVVGNDSVKDAVCVLTSTVDAVVFKCCVARVTDLSGVNVDFMPATSELLNVLTLPEVSLIDVKDVGNVVVGDEILAPGSTP